VDERRSPPSTCGCATTTPPTASAASIGWNKIIEKIGIGYKFELPHVAFPPQIGEFRDVKVTPTGDLVDTPPGTGTRINGCRRRRRRFIASLK